MNINKKSLYLLLALLFGLGVYFAMPLFSGKVISPSVTNFDECVEANGGAITSIYPPQCTYDGKTFVDDVTNDNVLLETYTSTSLGLSFDYQSKYSAVETENGVNLGFVQTPESSYFGTYLVVLKGDYDTKSTLPLCDPEDLITNCIYTDGWGQTEPIEKIKVDGKEAISFYYLKQLDQVFRVVELKDPRVVFEMNVAGGGLDEDFKQILETVKFL